MRIKLGRGSPAWRRIGKSRRRLRKDFILGSFSFEGQVRYGRVDLGVGIGGSGRNLDPRLQSHEEEIPSHQAMKSRNPLP
jgi:hypothetical protein